jgi:hypothetical protein
MESFTAEFAHAEETGDGWTAGLADHHRETTRYVLFQRLQKPTEQDLAFGFDEAHLEMDDQGFSGYGVIEGVTLCRNVLAVILSEKGRQELRVHAGSFHVKVNPSLDLRVFIEVMRAIFGDRFAVE